MYHAARRLIEAITILLQPSAGLYGIQNAALPLEVALEYVTAVSPSSSGSKALLETLKSLKSESAGRLTRMRDASSMPYRGSARFDSLPWGSPLWAK